jgi:hypothetical protein
MSVFFFGLFFFSFFFFLSDVTFFKNIIEKLTSTDSTMCTHVNKLIALTWPQAYLSYFSVKNPNSIIRSE